MPASRYAQRFSQHEQEGRKAFIPFTLLGWPNPEASWDILKAMVDADVSALELGFAFSDPVADGPVIQTAAMEVLRQGFNVDGALDLIRRARALTDTLPIGLLVYTNMVMARGVERFFKDVAAAGVDGVLMADLPPEMAEEVAAAAKAADVALIFIISPLTTAERLTAVQRYADGFLYAVSRLGITGVDETVDQDLQSLIARAKRHCSLPVCVGFGISSPQQAANMVALGADGVITGSKVIQLVRERTDGQSVADTLTPFFRGMMEAVTPKEEALR